MSQPLNIAIAGLGTVGAATVRLVQEHGSLLASRCGRDITIVAVSARDRDRDRDRGINLDGIAWVDDPLELAGQPGIDAIVEVIGGADGIARKLTMAALSAGRHVITANKALIAHHGTALAHLAEDNGVSLRYEAAVAGGIPIVKALREGLAGNSIGRIYGILNGTCNYILTTMRESGREFDDVLAEAQALGYAEADPRFDIDGIDTAHKLAILTALAFGCEVDFDAIYVEGIGGVSADDIRFAEELGYRIKLLGIARRTKHGIEQRVHPCLVAQGSAIASVENVFNAVVADGDYVETTVYQGRGAGGGPTASAVVADILDVARGDDVPTFAIPAGELAASNPAPMERHNGPYYICLTVRDEPGVMAEVTAAFRDEAISLESMLQRSRAPGEPVPVVLITHETEEAAMVRALANIGKIATMAAPPRMIRIEAL
ncbi:MAG: homoserine dehydrogenase [Alphaproteobacteria bacterium]|nr:homoserine dehydrogenase [Alphaproteobacteria bacterium]